MPSIGIPSLFEICGLKFGIPSCSRPGKRAFSPAYAPLLLFLGFCCATGGVQPETAWAKSATADIVLDLPGYKNAPIYLVDGMAYFFLLEKTQKTAKPVDLPQKPVLCKGEDLREAVAWALLGKKAAAKKVKYYADNMIRVYGVWDWLEALRVEAIATGMSQSYYAKLALLQKKIKELEASANDASFTLNTIKKGAKTVDAAMLPGDGKKIIFRSGTSVYRMNSDGTGSPRKAADLPSDTSIWDVNYNASKALAESTNDFYNLYDNNVYVMDLNAGSLAEIHPCVSGVNINNPSDDKRCLYPSSARLGGDGKRVFFSSYSEWDCAMSSAGWNCAKDQHWRLWSVPADDPSNPSKVEMVFDPEDATPGSGYGNFGSMNPAHSGDIAFSYSYEDNTGSRNGGIYISRNNVPQKVYGYEGASGKNSLSLFSPDGKWLVCERGGVFYVFNTEKKSETKVVGKADAYQGGAEVSGINEDGQWLLFKKFFSKKDNTLYRYAMVSRDGTKAIPVMREDFSGGVNYIYPGTGNPVSYDGKTVLFLDDDVMNRGDLHVAVKEENQCVRP